MDQIESPQRQHMEVERSAVPTMFLAVYALIVVAIGLVTSAWSRGPSFDEVKFYLPALEFFSRAWPNIPITDYPFPTPPLLIVLQSWFYGATGASVFATRLLSTGTALVVAAYLFRRSVASAGRDAAWFSFAIVCYPFFLWLSFTVKHYVYINGLLLIGLDQWQRSESENRPLSLVLSGALLSMAVASNQFSLPMTGALAANAAWGWLRGPKGAEFPWERLIAAACPIAVMALFYLIWGAAQPPSWTKLPDSNNATYRFDVRQIMMGFMVLGFWVAPLSRNPREMLVKTGVFWLPASLLLWQSHLFWPDTDFFNTPIGPLSNSIAYLVLRNHSLAVGIGGLLIAAGIAFLTSGGGCSKNAPLIRWLVLAYIGMTALALPSLYESYYTMLILPTIWLVGTEPHESPLPTVTRLWLVSMCCFGIIGTIVQLRKPPVSLPPVAVVSPSN